jgi:hypothetical protein
MIRQLFEKWFGLDPRRCEACEILREQLTKSERERSELLHRLLDKDKSEPPPATQEEYKPITPQFTPWRVKQQMLEAEDRKKAQLMRDKAKEIEELEKELGVDASQERKTV